MARKLTPQALARDPDRYMNIEKASTYTTFSVPSLYRRISNKTIPHLRVGRRVLFDRVELDKWLSAFSTSVFPE